MIQNTFILKHFFTIVIVSLHKFNLKNLKNEKNNYFDDSGYIALCM